jgi:hypothetical protein
MGSVVVKAPESAGWLSGSSLYVGAVNGDAKGSKNDPTLLYVGVSLATPIKELSLGASADLLFNGGGTGALGGSYANAYAFYTGYQITEKLKANNRFEYATSGYGAFLNRNGADDKIIGETFTLDYALWSNVLTRGEFRWDRCVDGRGNPFDGQKNDLSLTASIVYKF